MIQRHSSRRSRLDQSVLNQRLAASEGLNLQRLADVKYSKVEDADWGTCSTVLNAVSMREILSQSW